MKNYQFSQLLIFMLRGVTASRLVALDASSSNDEVKTNTCTFCSTRCHMLWYDGYGVAFIRRCNDTAERKMHDSLYKRMVFSIV
jgi:hypothetical protein